MDDDKRNEKQGEERRVRCRCGHKFHRRFGFYPDVRLLDLPGLREKLGRPIEAPDLDDAIMCRTCADVRRSLQLPPEEMFKGKAFDYNSTGKRVAEFEEEFASAVVCSECGSHVAEKKAFVPNFGKMKERLGRVARLADLPKVTTCSKCVGTNHRDEAATFFPLKATRGAMERDEEKRKAEARARSERAVREQLGLAVQEAPAPDREPAMRTPLAQIAGVGELTIEHVEDEECEADILTITPASKPTGRGKRREQDAKKAARKPRGKKAVGEEE